jgi:hypothetical protein
MNSQAEAGFPDMILTPRLRNLPKDDWTEADFQEEILAWKTRTEESVRLSDNMQRLYERIGPLWADHPDATIDEMIALLPESEHRWAHDIATKAVALNNLTPIGVTSNRQTLHVV